MDFSKVKKEPILLQEENRRFASDQTQAIHGHIKMQNDAARGIITVHAENLKIFQNHEYTYQLILVGMKKEKRRYHLAGTLSLDPSGTASGSFRINTQNIDGHGLTIADLCAAIIAAGSTVNSRESLHPVLKGDIVPSQKSSQSKSITPKDYSPFYNRIVLENCINIAKLQQKFADIIPFRRDLTNAQWKKVTDCKLFPMISPGAHPPMNQYHHFLFGWNDSHYFLGIPGRFFPKEQPDQGNSGFVFWQPILGMENEEGSDGLSIDQQREKQYGYWIAAINRYNGHIEEIPLREE